MPTTYLEGEASIIIYEGAAVFGLEDDLDVAIARVAAQLAPLLRFNIGPVDEFRAEIVMDSLDGVESFGLAYGIAEDGSFVRFSINPTDNTWQVDAVSAEGEAETLDSGPVLDVDADTVQIRAIAPYFRIEVGQGEAINQLIQSEVEIAPGGLAAWVAMSDSAEPLPVAALRAGFVGESAFAAAEELPTPASVISFEAFLLEDARAIQASLLNNATQVDCPVYINLHESLDRHLDGDPDIARLARDVIDATALIYDECLINSPDEPYRANRSDLAQLNNDLLELISEIEATTGG